MLSDKAGKTRAEVAEVGGETSLGLSDKSGKTRAALDTDGDDTRLELYDKAGKVRAALGNYDLQNTVTGSTEHRAESSLVLFNERQSVLWEIP